MTDDAMIASKIALTSALTIFSILMLGSCSADSASNGTPQTPITGGEVIWYDTGELGTVPCFVIRRGTASEKREAMSCDWSRRVME